jgi:hypothetical protein
MLPEVISSVAVVYLQCCVMERVMKIFHWALAGLSKEAHYPPFCMITTTLDRPHLTMLLGHVQRVCVSRL